MKSLKIKNNFEIKITEENDQKYILKLIQKQFDNTDYLNQLSNEYLILKDLNIEGVRNVIRQDTIDGRNALVLEYFEGITLAKCFKENKIDLKDLIQIIKKIAEVLAEIHKKNIVHRDINSKNILINENLEICIIDFGLAVKLSSKQQHIITDEKLQGTLAYIAPELTGRINRFGDNRSDLYSLGVVMYELFASRLPFNTDNASKLIYNHIATVPKAPHLFTKYKSDPKIQSILSSIIMKLLEKSSEARYQTAIGLANDLDYCLRFFGSEAPLNQFKIGFTDYSPSFKISQKVYGRDKQISKLEKIFSFCQSGNKSMVLVSGSSGSGKTTLINEISSYITSNGGYLIKGKYDNIGQDIPYVGLNHAFNELIEQFLTESVSKLEQIKIRLNRGLGKIGKVLTPLVPRLEQIVGELPEVEDLEGQEAKNRFNFVFSSFINSICTKEKPIVLFLDDFQWADKGSFELIQKIMSSASTKYFMLVVVARKPIEKNISNLYSKIQEYNTDASHIELLNLNKRHIAELLEDSLDLPQEKISKLASVIYRKTGGNAFFTNQFLRSLYDEELLFFDYNQLRWNWNLSKIKELSITINVIDLMISKIEKLNNKTIDIIKVASCIGYYFTLDVVKELISLTDNEIQESIKELLEEGIIYKSGKGFKFLHNRIQQAVYQIILESDKNLMHYKIAKFILKNSQKEDLEEQIFEIVNHFNLGLNIVTKRDEKVIIAQFNVKAAKEAKESLAYPAALKHLEVAKSLLPENSWNVLYGLTLNVYIELAEVYFLNAEYEKSFNYGEEILVKARKNTDKTKIYQTKILTYTAQGKLQEAISYGINAIEHFGYKISKSPIMLHVLIQIIKSLFLFKLGNPEKLVHLKQMNDEEQIAVMSILSKVLGASFAGDPNVFPLVVLHIFNNSLKYGYTLSTPMAIIGYGLIASGFFGRYKRGYHIGQSALKLYEKINQRKIKTEIYFGYYTFIDHWRKPVKDSLANLIEAVQNGQETGNVDFTSYSAANYSCTAFHAGEDLTVLKKRVKKYQNIIDSAKNEYMLNYIKVFHQAIINLTENVEEPFLIKGKICDRNNILDGLKKDSDKSIVCHVNIAEMKLCCYYFRYDKAIEHAKEAKKHLQGIMGTISIPVFYFYESFVYLMQSIYDKDFKLKKSIINKTLRKIKNWSNNAPENNLHRYYLLKALKAFNKKSEMNARKWFDKAILAVQESGYHNEEALIYETAGYFYEKYQYTFHAETCYRKALVAYEKWGAENKVKLLLRKKAKYLDVKKFSKIRDESSGIQSFNLSNSTTTSTISIDLNSILNASQTISGEMQLEKLVEKMMVIVLENAGAEKSLLILKKNNEWILEAKLDTAQNEKSKVELMEKKVLISGSDDNFEFSESVVFYCLRTQDVILLNDAENEGLFVSDYYIKAKKSKSILVIPLLNQGEILGVLYFENNVMTDAFTQQHLEVLKMLSSQMAISLENASLYENLENKVEERTRELNEAMRDLNIKSKSITNSINYAKRIQEAILPEMSSIRKAFPDSFIFFKPRDIVSGDFYCFEKIKAIEGDYYKYIIAAVDCTGHGVPGAFMSMIGNGLLTQIIHIKNMQHADDILYELHYGVVNALKQEVTNNSDGMDIALCVIDPKKKELEYSGAYNHLAYVQNNEFNIIKANKNSIGGLKNLRNKKNEFSQNFLSFDKPTTIYMYSDGYKDQFGSNGRKYTNGRFYKLLENLSKFDMKTQGKLIEQDHNNWIGDAKQLDDIIVVGIDLSRIF